MDIYSLFIYYIITLKIIFVILSVYQIYMRKKHEESTEKYNKISYIKSRIEFIFIASMALLLILLFNPLNKNRNKNKNTICVDNETRVLLFLFGVILIITSKWDLFFATSPIFKDIQIVL